MPGGYEAPGQRRVAVDVGVGAGRHFGGTHNHLVIGQLGGLTVGVAGIEGSLVGSDDQVTALELGLDPLDGRLDGTAVHPREQTEGEEVLGPFCVPGLHAQLLAGLLGERGHRRPDQPIGVEVVALQRVMVIAGLGQVALDEGVGVDDHGATVEQGGQLGPECRRVHGDQHVWSVAGREDVVVRNVDLEGRDAGERSGRGADLGRVFREGGEVVAEQGTRRGEPLAGELHAVARVAGEPNDHAPDLGDQRLRSRFGHVIHLRSGSVARFLIWSVTLIVRGRLQRDRRRVHGVQWVTRQPGRRQSRVSPSPGTSWSVR